MTPNKFDSFVRLGLVFVAVLFIYSLVGRVPDLDDAWLGEHAYWQYKLGYVKSELMRGITMEEIRLLCHHKLFTLQGAFIILIFGFSLISLKMITLLYLFVFMVIFYLYSRNKFQDKLDLYLFSFLMLTNFLVFQFSFVYRPEIPVMTLGFISYIFLEKSLTGKDVNYTPLILAGFFAGLCAATHLNGVIFPVSGFILLVWNKKVKDSLVFGFASVPAILIYFYDFTKAYNFKFWFYQLNASPSIQTGSEEHFGLGFLTRVLTEHMRFFHAPPEISFTLLLVFSVFSCYSNIKAYKNLLRFTLLLMITLAVFSVHKSSRYMLLYFPYLMILLTIAIKNIKTGNIQFPSREKSVRIMLALLLVFYFGTNVYKNILLAKDKFDPEANRDLVKKYIADQADTCRIIAPMTFIFDEIKYFKSIQSEFCYTEMQNLDSTIYQRGFLNKADSFGIQYIIGSKGFLKEVGLDTYNNSHIESCGYKVVMKDQDKMILKREKNLSVIAK